MFRFVLIIAIFISSVHPASAQEKKRFALYAMLTETVPVELSDGSRWKMDPGDTFPLVMYKERQTKLVLQLASTTFMVSAEQAKVIEDKDLTEAQLASYHANVNNFLDSRSAKWKAQAKHPTK